MPATLSGFCCRRPRFLHQLVTEAYLAEGAPFGASADGLHRWLDQTESQQRLDATAIGTGDGGAEPLREPLPVRR